MRCLQLPFRFDPERLRADLERVESHEWIAHMQRKHYDGQWSGAALRSIGGVAHNIVPDAQGAEVFCATALLARCAYFQEVLATFRCPLNAARLLRLHAGSSIAEHVDRALDFDDGEVRIHIPIVTSDAVKFYLDGARLVMAPGECWYTNVNLPHGVENHGTIDRIHLVIDCIVDDWLRELFARTPPPPCEHYAAHLILPAPPPLEQLLGLFGRVARAGVKFQAEGRTMILTWPGTHAWQFRLCLPANAESTWQAELESSPDPGGGRRDEYRALLDQLAGALSGLVVVQKGLS